MTAGDELAEYLMLRLRLAEGIDAQDYSVRFGKDFFTQFEAAVDISCKAGLIEAGQIGNPPDAEGLRLAECTDRRIYKKTVNASGTIDFLVNQCYF